MASRVPQVSNISTNTDDKITFFEKVNHEICNKFSIMTFSEFQNIAFPEVDETGNNDDIQTQYNMIVKYCQDMRNNNYCKKMEYKYAKGKNSGRIFVNSETGTGLQRIWKQFRGLLCNGIYTDFDMINAHPTILTYICKKHNIPCYAITNYCNNRDSILNTFMEEDNITREEAKLFFIISINNEKHITVNKGRTKLKNKEFLNFDKEIKKIQNLLIDKYPEEYKLTKSTKRENINGSFLNNILCKYENQILQENIKNFSVGAPMFDGFLLDNEGKTEEEIKEIKNVLNMNSEKYNIKWSIKEHDMTLYDDIMNIKETPEKIQSYIGTSEIDVAKFCLNTILKNKIFECHESKWIFSHEYGIWVLFEGAKSHDLLHRIISPHDLWISEGNKNPYPANKSYNSLTTLCKSIISHIPVNPDLYQQMHDTTRYKIFYKNGYYDFIKGSFQEYDYDNLPYTTIRINRDYNPKVNKQTRHQIFKRIFYPIFDIDFSCTNIRDYENEPEKYENDINFQKYMNLKYNLYIYSRVIAGHTEEKRWLCMIGERNSGKGVFNLLFEKGFQNYIGQLDSGDFIIKDGSGDTSKDNMHYMQFEFKRAIFMSELVQCTDRTGKPKYKLNGKALKQVASGGDTLRARMLYQNPRDITIQGSLIMQANDMPPVEPADALNNVVKFNMPCTFLPQDEIDAKTEIEKKTLLIKPADMSIKAWLKNDDVINEFYHILFEAYKTEIKPPKIVKEDKNTEYGNNSEKEKFFNLFTITNNHEEDILTNNEIVSLLENNRVGFSITKATQILCKLGCIRTTKGKNRALSGLTINKENQ